MCQPGIVAGTLPGYSQFETASQHLFPRSPTLPTQTHALCVYVVVIRVQ